MAMLPERARELFNGPHHVVVATIDPDGRPQSSVVWAKAEGDEVVFSTIKGRRKYANLSRDPRLTVLVFDPANPYRYVEVRGTATVTDDPAAELIEELSVKYTGQSFGKRPGEQRVIVRIRPDHVVEYDD